ncbi:MAG: hypothetical protein AB1656_09790 [Candidatus Omnitrophota bacterium]
MKFRRISLWMLPLIASLCSCTESVKISMRPAAVQLHDVFTCKGLSQDDRWIGVTDQFMPDQDSSVVVVANLAPEDQKTWVHFELTNPFGNVVLKEEFRYPKDSPLAVAFEMSRLMKLGGEGEWKALALSDGLPIGQAIFYIGEKPKTEEETKGPRFFVVGDEVEEASAELEVDENNLNDRFADYIREVTPEITAPSIPEAMEPSSLIPSATP